MRDHLDELEISPERVREMADAGEDFVLLDVREDWEWERAHLDGAIHIPLGELESRLGELDPSREVVVYCHVGERSVDACLILWNADHQDHLVGAEDELAIREHGQFRRHRILDADDPHAEAAAEVYLLQRLADQRLGDRQLHERVLGVDVQELDDVGPGQTVRQLLGNLDFREDDPFDAELGTLHIDGNVLTAEASSVKRVVEMHELVRARLGDSSALAKRRGPPRAMVGRARGRRGRRRRVRRRGRPPGLIALDVPPL